MWKNIWLENKMRVDKLDWKEMDTPLQEVKEGIRMSTCHEPHERVKRKRSVYIGTARYK